MTGCGSHSGLSTSSVFMFTLVAVGGGFMVTLVRRLSVFHTCTEGGAPAVADGLLKRMLLMPMSCWRISSGGLSG